MRTTRVTLLAALALIVLTTGLAHATVTSSGSFLDQLQAAFPDGRPQASALPPIAPRYWTTPNNTELALQGPSVWAANLGLREIDYSTRWGVFCPPGSVGVTGQTCFVIKVHSDGRFEVNDSEPNYHWARLDRNGNVRTGTHRLARLANRLGRSLNRLPRAHKVVVPYDNARCGGIYYSQEGQWHCSLSTKHNDLSYVDLTRYGT